MLAQGSLERRLLLYLKPHWKLILAGIGCSLIVSLISLSVAGIAKDALDALTPKATAAEHTRDTAILLRICFGLVGLYALRWIFSWGQTWIFSEIAQQLGIDLRTQIYTHLQKLSLAYFDNQRTGNLLSTFSNDVPVLQNGIMTIKDLVSSPALAIGGFFGILYISWQLTLICIIILPMMGFAMGKITKRLRQISLETQNKLAEVTTITEETLAGARLVRAFSAEQREIDRYGNSLKAAKDIYMSGVIRSALLTPTTDLIGSIGLALALWVGGNEIIRGGELTVGGLGAFVYLIDRIRVGVSGMGSISVTWKQTHGAADRIFGSVLDVPSDVVDSPNAKMLDLSGGFVRFEHVSFGYRKDRTVLRDITFEMPAGQVTALVGPSGAGKSTLADLVPRFYDISSGTLTIDDQDIRSVSISSLREHIGIVPQETIVFGGTVRENIAYGRPNADIETVIEAAKHANAHDFITAMPKGYDTVIGERGVMLSGGQRQRLAIARALIKDPRILILDEATSSLDETSQVLVQEALDMLMKGRTTLVIAHRLSTIKGANRIVVLDEGRVVECGSHRELLQLGGTYARLYETQFRNDADDIGLSDDGD